ncbi:protein of unknown function [Limnospira indica PCC 8005]|uniref:Uncharacterized protein n=1 Tax=Limnospira indica PCC 8005 TaxID=376219 RepID=A0A9P1NZ58_9CYAN|nr:protein of unknown function [Limnospira indica PCC 8005]
MQPYLIPKRLAPCYLDTLLVVH